MAGRSHYNEKIVDQHTRQAEGYARLTQSMAGEARRMPLSERLALRGDELLLDIACGPGSIALDLSPHVAKTTGLDITPAMLDQARAAQAERGIADVDWVHGDGAAMPFPDGAFTLVTCSAAFHHFEAPARVLAEMERVCAAGGRVVVMDVTPEAGKAAAYDRMETMRDPSHGHAHSVAELTAMAGRLGLVEPSVHTSLAGPIPYDAVLATSFPEEHSREELLALMREDGESAEDRLGFHAAIQDGAVMVSFPMSTLIWSKP